MSKKPARNSGWVAAKSFGPANALRSAGGTHMSSARFHRIISVVAAILILLLGANTFSYPVDEPEYLGKTLNYWIEVIRNRDEQMMPLAFEAIGSLGSAAEAAVPDLITIVTAPFSPIYIGRDSQRVIASKLYDIETRAAAIDTLTLIGESASSASAPTIGWALIPKVIPDTIRSKDDEELFIELVMMDTEHRMRVAGAIGAFGKGASPAIALLLSSKDAEKRKLGVAILSQDALPIAADLLRSPRCDDQNLGLLILRDMGLVVAKSHLDSLQQMVGCNSTWKLPDWQGMPSSNGR